MVRTLFALCLLLCAVARLTAGPETEWEDRLTSKEWIADAGSRGMVIVTFDKPTKSGKRLVILDVAATLTVDGKSIDRHWFYVGDYRVGIDGGKAVVTCSFRQLHHKAGNRPAVEEPFFKPSTVTLVLERKERTMKVIGEKDGKFVPVDKTYRYLAMHFASEDVKTLGWWRPGTAEAVEMVE